MPGTQIPTARIARLALFAGLQQAANLADDQFADRVPFALLKRQAAFDDRLTVCIEERAEQLRTTQVQPDDGLLLRG